MVVPDVRHCIIIHSCGQGGERSLHEREKIFKPRLRRWSAALVNSPVNAPELTQERSHEGSWVFVTENPSVTTAALELPPAVPVRLLCTVGTPSATELDTLARLADSGWRIAVRADFDASGIQHMRAALRAVPRARPWRMNAEDYVRSLHPTPFQPTALDTKRLPETEWDPALHTVMRAQGRPAYEEALLDNLLDDIRRGHPHP
ncbi:DUF2399 domain-containing protein [Streptomyces sp. NPDC059816]|uniref:DUF2399 domain-containing protein n=1 Tax=Streptomyces sp. NPDC059816 TaxID=3346960 RepID=UPI00364EEF94